MPTDIEAAVAAITERDPNVGPYADLAANMLTAGEDIEVLSQAYLQDTLWWRMPKRFDADDWEPTAAGAAALLEELGLHRYAEIARSDATARILEAWREDPEKGHAEATAVRVASGLVPPDTAQLAWGSIMGGEEADALTAVERALEDGLAQTGLKSDSAKWRRTAMEITAGVLNAPLDFPPGQTRLTMIITDRLESWINTVRVSQLQTWRQAVANRLLHPVEVPADAHEVLAPMVWLLGLAADEVTLTPSRYLKPDVVREAVDRFGWWDWDKPPRSESDVPQLLMLRDMAQHLRLIRRKGTALVLTKAGAAALADPEVLWQRMMPSLGGTDEFGQIMAELVGLRLLDGETDDHSLIDALLPVVNQLGWRADDSELVESSLSGAVWDLRHWWRLIGVMEYRSPTWDRVAQRQMEPERTRLTPGGVSMVLAYLRDRAIAPRHDFPG